MPFWTFWLRKQPSAPAPLVVEQEPRPSFTEADRDYVRDALPRFEASGLQVCPDLDRDLIMVRALIDIERWKPDHRMLNEDDLVSLFLALACETDSLTYYADDVQQQYAALSSMDDETAETWLQEHSFSVFVNAGSISTVNEADSLEDMVRDFCTLADLSVDQIRRRIMKNGLTLVSFEVDGLGSCGFEISSRKRPDIMPLFTEMNRIAQIKSIGRFIVVQEGNSESETFICASEAVLPGIIDLLKLDLATISRA